MVCGVRGEILSLTNGEGKVKGRVVVLRSSEDNDEEFVGEEDGGEGELRARSLIVTNLELGMLILSFPGSVTNVCLIVGTGCSRDYHPGPPSDFAQTTTSRLHRLLLSTTSLISPESLRITDTHAAEIETKAYWVLYIDILCISLDGNILDTAWASVIAALRSTRLPRAYWDADLEVVVCDPDLAKYTGLQLGKLAFTASFAVISGVGDDGKSMILSDPDEFEESVCEESVMVCIKEGGKIARIEKGGGSACGMEGLGECVHRARNRFDVWERLVKSAMV